MNETPVAYEDNNTPWNQLYDTGGAKVDYLPLMQNMEGNVYAGGSLNGVEGPAGGSPVAGATTVQPAGWFENILNQTGNVLGDLVRGTVETGAGVLQDGIRSLGPNQPAPVAAPDANAVNVQKWGMIALGVVLVVWAYKQSKK
jgi:hypothetical protein